MYNDLIKLFGAFLAGFIVSGEGFNGEYVGKRFQENHDLFINTILEQVGKEIWRANVGR